MKQYAMIYSGKSGVKASVLYIKPEDVKIENNLVVYRNTDIRIVLQKAIHRDLAKELAEKVKSIIISGQRDIDVDPLYEEIEAANTKKYLYKRGCSVEIEGKMYTKGIYKSGEGYFYKDMQTKEWIKVDCLDKDRFIQR